MAVNGVDITSDIISEEMPNISSWIFAGECYVEVVKTLTL